MKQVYPNLGYALLYQPSMCSDYKYPALHKLFLTKKSLQAYLKANPYYKNNEDYKIRIFEVWR